MSIDARILLASPAEHEGDCCECCEGYCPKYESPGGKLEWDQFLFALHLDGVEYVTNRFVIVRAEALEGLPDGGEVQPFPGDPGVLRDQLPAVPDERPAPSKSPMSVPMLDRFDRLGLDYCGTGEKVVHLYAGDQHIGWTTIATKGPNRDDFRLIRAFASEFRCGASDAAAAIRILDELQAGDPR